MMDTLRENAMVDESPVVGCAVLIPRRGLTGFYKRPSSEMRPLAAAVTHERVQEADCRGSGRGMHDWRYSIL